jgi:hypothetical protein
MQLLPKLLTSIWKNIYMYSWNKYDDFLKHRYIIFLLFKKLKTLVLTCTKCSLVMLALYSSTRGYQQWHVGVTTGRAYLRTVVRHSSHVTSNVETHLIVHTRKEQAPLRLSNTWSRRSDISLHRPALRVYQVHCLTRPLHGIPPLVLDM